MSAFISATKSGCLEWGAETSTGRRATGVDKSARLTSSYPALGHCFGGSDLQYGELLVSYCGCFRPLLRRIRPALAHKYLTIRHHPSHSFAASHLHALPVAHHTCAYVRMKEVGWFRQVRRVRRVGRERRVLPASPPRGNSLQYPNVKAHRSAHELHILSVLNLLVYEPCIY